MYVPPRPSARDDPHYGIRLGLTGALSFAAVPLLDPAMPAIMAALPVGLVAAQRKAFSPVKVIAAPVAVCVVATVMAAAVTMVQALPVLYVAAMWAIYFLGFRMILGSGLSAGMLLVVMGVLFSVMGMMGSVAVTLVRNEFFLAALVALIVIPLAYALVPARTAHRHVDTPKPQRGNITIGAAVRATVLLGVSFWLYSVMQPSDIMLAVMAAMVLVFPTRRAVFFEAYQRLRATLYGSLLACAVLALFLLSQHLVILLGLIFLAGFWTGQRVLYERTPHLAYQNGYPVALALIAGALSTQDPSYAILTRVVLTLLGAFAAAAAVALLDQVTGWRGASKPRGARRIEPTDAGALG